MDSNTLLPIFNTAEERQEYIKENANYFVLTWRQDRKNVRLEYGTLKSARIAAGITAKYINRSVLIYAVITPFSDVSEPYGYSSWIETVRPSRIV
jgi:hypothetical protein